MAASRFENGVLSSHIAARNDTGSANQRSTNIGEDGSIKVGHDKDIELLRPGNSLHRSIIDNQIIDLELGVILGNLHKGGPEQAVGELHDVRLVNTGNFLPLVGSGKRESKLADPLRLHFGNDLEGFDHTGNRLMLQTRVFTLRVFANDTHVNTGVTGDVARHILDQNNRGIDVEFLTKGNVERLMAGALYWGIENT